MLSDPDVCGAYSTDLTLRNEPLRAAINGGDRSVGDGDAFSLDACASGDPDDPQATCNVDGECGELISFDWSCAPYNASEHPALSTAVAFGVAENACGLPAAPDECEWYIDGGTLPVGLYAFGVRASKPDGESASAFVLLTVKAGLLPTVSIGTVSCLGEALRATLSPAHTRSTLTSAHAPADS